jgi:hypothetical protein
MDGPKVDPAQSTRRPPPAPLPEGVTRDPYCGPETTLETCEAIALRVRQPDGREVTWICWRENRSPKAAIIRPLNKRRLRDLRAGDRVRVGYQVCVVVGLELYR